MASNAVFITATGTGVGKTLVSSLLIGFLREQGIKAGYQKWVSTGGEMPEDLLYCQEKNHLEFDQGQLDSQVVYRFLMPASPHLAAEQERREVDPDKITEIFTRSAGVHEVLVVEGVGGVLVPLRRDLLLADFLACLQLPVIIVAHSGLGTVNHTLLTIEALRQRKLPVLGVVFSDEQEGLAVDDPLVADNMRTIGDMAGVEVFGRLLRLGDYALLEQAFQPVGKAIWQKFRLMAESQPK
ncbi:MAG: dethiobiotin synthase [Proteobacteria bacterium]|nr:dethiobiotin synthase [Pseudomonadota bacterium]MBU4297352.1 dethiobiotin synthase [Pseudomonadota bacterium]